MPFERSLSSRIYTLHHLKKYLVSNGGMHTSRLQPRSKPGSQQSDLDILHDTLSMFIHGQQLSVKSIKL